MSNLGKIPPQNIEIEEAVLGSLIIDKSRQNIIDSIEPDYFYSENNRIIFEAIVALKKQNNPIDVITIANYLSSTNKLEQVGGRVYLSNLTSKVASTNHLEFHSYILEQKYILRKLIKDSSELERDCYNDETDQDELIERVKRPMTR